MINYFAEDALLRQIDKDIKENLSRRRYIHSIAVANIAASLAMAHGEDIYSAYVAGLLHDNAKNLDLNEMKYYLKKFKIQCKDLKEEKSTLHAPIGAKLAIEKYGISNEVASAIEFHTTGNPKMNNLDKIIYIADYIEPNREVLPQIDKIRMEAFKDLNMCMKKIIEQTIQYLNNKHVSIHPITKETLIYLEKEILNDR